MKQFDFVKTWRTSYMINLEKQVKKDLQKQKEELYRRINGKIYFTGNKTIFDEESDDEFLEL